MSSDVKEPAVLLGLHIIHKVEAWLHDGSNQASSGHVEPSDSDMYDMENQLHEVAAWPCQGFSLSPILALCPPIRNSLKYLNILQCAHIVTTLAHRYFDDQVNISPYFHSPFIPPPIFFFFFFLVGEGGEMRKSP